MITDTEVLSRLKAYLVDEPEFKDVTPHDVLAKIEELEGKIPVPPEAFVDIDWSSHERQVNEDLDDIHGVEQAKMSEPVTREYMLSQWFLGELFGEDNVTPDAVGQLAEVFVPCLRIMCTRGYDPTGGLWRKAGVLGIIWDVRKKFERLWYRTWTLGIRHDDSGFDLINFVGMLLRADPDSRFGDAGEPASMPQTEGQS